VLALAAAGCGSAGAARGGSESVLPSGRGAATAAGTVPVADLPDFVLNPPDAEDVIYGTGSAKLANTQLAMSTAEARARRSIALTLEANVKGMLIDYASSAGTDANQQGLQLAEDVGRQLVNAKLSGTKVVKREQSKDGTFWVLMSYPKNAAASAAADAMKNVLNNEAARYAEFKTMNALDAMEKQLEKGDVKVTPVTSD